MALCGGHAGGLRCYATVENLDSKSPDIRRSRGSRPFLAPMSGYKRVGSSTIRFAEPAWSRIWSSCAPQGLRIVLCAPLYAVDNVSAPRFTLGLLTGSSPTSGANKSTTYKPNRTGWAFDFKLMAVGVAVGSISAHRVDCVATP
jgi:hypothetical protein